jgi:hypothetical protein
MKILFHNSTKRIKEETKILNSRRSPLILIYVIVVILYVAAETVFALYSFSIVCPLYVVCVALCVVYCLSGVCYFV